MRYNHLKYSLIYFGIFYHSMFISCSSIQLNDQDKISKEENSEVIDETPDNVEKIDAFTNLVEKYVNSLQKIDKKTTQGGFHERGNGTLTMYFQGDYVIKMLENVEINGVQHKDTYYFYNLVPIYVEQEIELGNKTENNIIYLNDWDIIEWKQNGKVITDSLLTKQKQTEIKENINRFK